MHPPREQWVLSIKAGNKPERHRGNDIQRRPVLLCASPCCAAPCCRDKFLPVLSLLPVVGPALYLLLRPKTDMSTPSS